MMENLEVDDLTPAIQRTSLPEDLTCNTNPTQEPDGLIRVEFEVKLENGSEDEHDEEQMADIPIQPAIVVGTGFMDFNLDPQALKAEIPSDSDSDNSNSIEQTTPNRTLVCPKCGTQFANFQKLEAHVSTSHVDETLYFCNYCPAGFRLPSQLIFHIQKCNTRQMSSNGTATPREKTELCHLCPRAFTTKYELKIHIYSHTGEKPYTCKTCNKKFRDTRFLKIHERVHTGERPYSCEICGQRFQRKAHLTSHAQSHSEETPYSCSICGKSFKQLSSLQPHVKTHSAEKPFECESCGKSFKAQKSLKSHLITHAGESRYASEVCDKGFRTKSALDNHSVVHSGEKPFLCLVCGKGFQLRSQLKSHGRRMHVLVTATATTTDEVK